MVQSAGTSDQKAYQIKANGRNDRAVVENAARIMAAQAPGIASEAVRLLAKDMSVLSHPDCIALMFLCAKGHESFSNTYDLLGMSYKRYYVAIGKLLDSGYITKVVTAYKLTHKGVLALERLTDALADVSEGNGFELAESMLKSRRFSGDVRKLYRHLRKGPSAEAKAKAP